MILVALGANSDGPWGPPRAALQQALLYLDRGGITLRRASRLLVTAPLGVTGQPDFVNAVADVETALSPEDLLARLHGIEREAGRERTLRWGPRTLDLDLIDYHGLIRRDAPPVLPHPGIAGRIFVLAPIAEIAPDWRHPETGLTAPAMLERLDQHGEGRLL
ncbi:2-amino-4-hydroxy-6-hydroxymethyldihydropteridine diphosphokinase [Aestuariivirga sp.]|uniref:2-amino-4-hydroxy-6- hydroxymethyldihydropteridine diphosphokinase n=1 Tax=Aestuariivirga sp. TaxID=2650926 RepID=UPI0025C1440C|nr:2-amino-4-hydroxy-6-hydroxymethyldihydropteridine diphosphokinase [Aestuariivirga sp.]MCA3555198.1 2-amino-4-hydroxy-6-hydroxymethyldihydropteridine diphosphokinase [Aestuariivirga sp.]